MDELYDRPFTFLGDHASFIKRIQRWRQAVSYLTAWCSDDGAYHDQARPEIVTTLEVGVSLLL